MTLSSIIIGIPMRSKNIHWGKFCQEVGLENSRKKSFLHRISPKS